MKKIYRSFFWKPTGELEDERNPSSATPWRAIHYWTEKSPEDFKKECEAYITGDWPASWDWVEVEYEEGV